MLKTIKTLLKEIKEILKSGEQYPVHELRYPSFRNWSIDCMLYQTKTAGLLDKIPNSILNLYGNAKDKI